MRRQQEFDQEVMLDKELMLDQKQKLEQQEFSRRWTTRRTTGVQVRQRAVAGPEVLLTPLNSITRWLVDCSNNWVPNPPMVHLHNAHHTKT